MVDTLIRVTGTLLGCCVGMESVQDSLVRESFWYHGDLKI
ncbi:unnamed protein product [Brassica rapa subsp. narinosa]|uniref:Uncharacterized protein n=1 Tax=Brassica campestris TaxID=3711 RepID=A0A3P5ZF83_BRACM|nr:unnamed protein product [Brassica rapa]